MTQVFFADMTKPHRWENGAIGYGPGGMMDCIGPFAKVVNCPVDGTDVRLTCYATSYADTWFSIPAVTRYQGKNVKGYLTSKDDGVVFCVMDSCKSLFPELQGKPKFYLTVRYHTRNGPKTWFGDVFADNLDVAMEMATREFRRQVPSARHCPVWATRVQPAKKEKHE